MTNNNKKEELNIKQQKFCQYYVELGNGTQAAIKAGYSERTAGATSSGLLQNHKIKREIDQLMTARKEKHIATGQEVMEFFTRMMNGEEKDQFGLEVSAGDRIKAAQELAKRTIDITNRQEGKADSKIEINLNWRRS